MQLWQLHVAEQMILDDEEANPDKYKDGKFSELTDDTEFDEENSIEYTHAHYKNRVLPKMILVNDYFNFRGMFFSHFILFTLNLKCLFDSDSELLTEYKC